MGRRFLYLILWLSGLFSAGAALASNSVIIVSSDRSAAYADAAQALVTDLEQAGLSRYEMLQVTAAEFLLSSDRSAKLIVTLGVEAAQVVANSDVRTPVLCVLLPRSSFERLLRGSGRKASSQFSAFYLDQPLSRQLELIRLALPSVRRVGVLWGPESQIQAASLRAWAVTFGFQLVEATMVANQPFFPGLKRVLDESDVLLALADPVVFNSNTIQNVLLAAFRARVPLLSFSPTYVRAGALLGLYVTPAQVGQHAGFVARGVLQGNPLPSSPLYAQRFSVAVNEHVARSLGLSLDANELLIQLRQREGSP